jgi:hypothetical protein
MPSHSYFYCRRVSRRGVGDHWTEARARRAHEKGKPYWVLVDSKDKPEVVVSTLFCEGNCGVHFLDDRWRTVMIYWFQVIDDKTVFLHNATLDEWDDDELDSHILRSTSFEFKQDGSFEQRDEDRVKCIDTYYTGTTDVRGNYSPMPTFGNYDDIIVRDRISLPMIQKSGLI